MLKFYFKTRYFAIFSVSFDIKSCLIVSSYKIYVSFSNFLVCIEMFFSGISQNLTISSIETTIRPQNEYYLTTFHQNLSKNLCFLLLDFVLLGWIRQNILKPYDLFDLSGNCNVNKSKNSPKTWTSY